MSSESQRRTESIAQSKHSWKLPKFGERDKLPDLRSLANPKQDEQWKHLFLDT